MLAVRLGLLNGGRPSVPVSWKMRWTTLDPGVTDRSQPSRVDSAANPKTRFRPELSMKVSVGHQRGRGVASGVSVESGEAHVWTVRHGKAVRLEMFHTVNDALEAVGLRE